MKSISAICLLFLLSVGCKKNDEGILIDKAIITILHTTCVKTIVKIDAPTNANIGVPWSNNSSINPIVYQRVIKAGDMKNVPTTGLEVSQQYKVKIYAKGTMPQVICYLLDQVNEPGVTYDIEFLP